ncbi:DUF1648 domain-containing protein [Corynebacterium sp. Q4381]|uniref:DUF1648 domain-containing protein n=1 Tax=Corynebacterium sp. Marseille-Q4381 TaxID=3121597 RepID=UPI002FE66829
MPLRRALPISGIIYLAVLAFVAARWDAIPDPVPMHIGPGGEVDRWSEKNFLSATAVTWIGVVISAAMALCAPKQSLAAARREPSDEGTLPNDALPYSESASQRAQHLIDTTNTFLGTLLIATSIVLALTQVMMLFPEIVSPTLWWVFFGLYMVGVVVASISLARTSRRNFDDIPADADELQRVDALKRVASMGLYSQPRDPMAVAVLPGEPGKLQINSAHPAGKQQLRRMGIGIGVSIVLVVLLAVIA